MVTSPEFRMPDLLWISLHLTLPQSSYVSRMSHLLFSPLLIGLRLCIWSSQWCVRQARKDTSSHSAYKLCPYSHCYRQYSGPLEHRPVSLKHQIPERSSLERIFFAHCLWSRKGMVEGLLGAAVAGCEVAGHIPLTGSKLIPELG